MIGAIRRWGRVAAGGIVLLASAVAQAELPPRLMNYQGLLDGYGSTTVHLEIRFYSASSGGTALFYEDQGDVALVDGLFALMIGTSTASGVPDTALNSAEVWIELSVDGTALSRTRVVSVPFAFASLYATALVMPDTLTPIVTVDASGNVGVNSKIELGRASDKGYLNLLQSDGDHGIELDGQTSGGGGVINVRGLTDPSVHIWGTDPDGNNGSLLELKYSGSARVRIDAHEPQPVPFGLGGGAAMSMFNSEGVDTVYLDADSSNAAALYLKNASNVSTISLRASDGFLSCGSIGVDSKVEIASANGKGYVNVLQSDGDHGIELDGQSSSGGGLVTVRGLTDPAVQIWGADTAGGGGSLIEMKYNGSAAIKLDAYQTGSGGSLISMWNSTGIDTVILDADQNNAALLTLKDSSNVGTISLNGAGGEVTCKVLNITGADLAERFPVSDKVEPGMVVEIDPEKPGQLRLSREAYNRRVAGVVSGAGELPAGAILGNLPGNESAPPIALSGRVWVYCDADSGAIEPGDRLTTSATPGHAMKTNDLERASGAVIGKAMTRLERGRGLVLVLVRPQ